MLTVRPGGGAAVGVVAKGVDVHAALGVGVVAADVVGDVRLGILGGLLEGHGALDAGISTEDGDCEGGMAVSSCSVDHTLSSAAEDEPLAAPVLWTRDDDGAEDALGDAIKVSHVAAAAARQ